MRKLIGRILYWFLSPLIAQTIRESGLSEELQRWAAGLKEMEEKHQLNERVRKANLDAIKQAIADASLRLQP